MRWILAGFLLTSTVPAISAESYYCPWADMVIRLTLNTERNKVDVRNNSRDTPWRTLDVVERDPQLEPTIVAGRKVLYFSEREGEYAYDYELDTVFGAGAMLVNRRVNLASGKHALQRGYCMNEATR